MQKNKKRAKDQDQIESSISQASILDDSQNVNESQETLGLSSLEPCFLTSRESRLLAFLAVIVYLATFVILTLAALGTQNLFLLSTIPMMARELTYMFHRVVDFLLPNTPTPLT